MIIVIVILLEIYKDPDPGELTVIEPPKHIIYNNENNELIKNNLATQSTPNGHTIVFNNTGNKEVHNNIVFGNESKHFRKTKDGKDVSTALPTLFDLDTQWPAPPGFDLDPTYWSPP